MWVCKAVPIGLAYDAALSAQKPTLGFRFRQFGRDLGQYRIFPLFCPYSRASSGLRQASSSGWRADFGGGHQRDVTVQQLADDDLGGRWRGDGGLAYQMLGEPSSCGAVSLLRGVHGRLRPFRPKVSSGQFCIIDAQIGGLGLAPGPARSGLRNL
jgi:hypothetical protein